MRHLLPLVAVTVPEEKRKVLNMKGDVFVLMNHLVSGSIAGAVSAVVMNPMDVARTRIQTYDTADQLMKGRGVMSMVAKTVEREGVAALFKGLLPRLWFGVIGSAITFAGYEWAKERAKASKCLYERR
eukprot:m.47780 g.47780  ORF g.47780 m.47780 type:complete len:128 (-) comp10790_c0_seq1:5-388(-)